MKTKKKNKQLQMIIDELEYKIITDNKNWILSHDWMFFPQTPEQQFVNEAMLSLVGQRN